MPDTSPASPYALHLSLQTAVQPPSVPWTEPPLCLRRPDGSTELLGTSRALLPAVRFVLGYGRYATVQGSDAVRQAVIAEARRIVARYTTPQAPTGPPRSAEP